MAIITPGPCGSISGRLGGSEFAIRRNSIIAKKSKSRAPVTSKFTEEMQRIMVQQGIFWAAMSPEKQAAYNNFASTFAAKDRFGRAKVLTGREVFMKRWEPCIISGNVNVVESPPSVAPLPVPNILSVSFTAGGPYNIETEYLSWIAYRGLRIARFLSPGQNPSYRTFAHCLWVFPGTETQDHSFGIGWRFGSLQSGERVGIAINYIGTNVMPGPFAYTVTTVS